MSWDCYPFCCLKSHNTNCVPTLLILNPPSIHSDLQTNFIEIMKLSLLFIFHCILLNVTVFVNKVLWLENVINNLTSKFDNVCTIWKSIWQLKLWKPFMIELLIFFSLTVKSSWTRIFIKSFSIISIVDMVHCWRTIEYCEHTVSGVNTTCKKAVYKVHQVWRNKENNKGGWEHTQCLTLSHRVAELKAETQKLQWKEKTQEQESEEMQRAVWHCRAAIKHKLLKGNFSWLN